MSPSTTEFTRIVLGLDQRLSDPAILRFAADFARLLHLDLFGLFAEDPSLARLAELPTLREFRLLERQWRPIEGRDLSGDLQLCIESAQRSFNEIARTLGVSRHFEVVRARILEAIASVSGKSDIVLVAEPRAAAHFAWEGFAETVAAALATPAAVLVVPNPIVRTHGPILAIGETDRDVGTAAAIAAAANERLEVIAARDSSAPRHWRLPALPGERLIVMTRRVSAGLSPLSVLSRRRVPVLVVGDGNATGAGSAEPADVGQPPSDQPGS